jgi:NAD(P)-dependent dehydrogenase (short-subunit alcohol dehydrogenase family)
MLGRLNPVALITGASRGIGRGIALALAAEGWDLVLNFASNEVAAKETAGRCREVAMENSREIQTYLCQADISQDADRRRLIQFTRDSCHKLDLLVNNAGIAPKVRADILETSEASFDQVMNVNVRGPFFLTQLVARWWTDQPSGTANSPGSRKIITISSLSAVTVSVNRPEYCISKAALSMLTPLYAARLAEYGIQVFEVRPGIIETEMTRGVKEKYDGLIAGGLTPIKRWGTPEDVGKAVVACASGMLSFSTGEVINVDGGFHLRIL